MVGKNNELNKSRHIFEHINRYSIRKFKVGVASVAIAGCFVLPMGTNTVSATEVKTEELLINKKIKSLQLTLMIKKQNSR